MAGDSPRFVGQKLAVLFHDPPWKPWGIGKTPFSLTGTGNKKKYWEAILEKTLDMFVDYSKALSGKGWIGVLEALDRKFIGGKPVLRRIIEEVGKKGAGPGKLARVVSRALSRVAEDYYKGLVEELKKCDSSARRSHEVQGALMLLLVEKALEKLGKELGKEEALEDAIDAARTAFKILCGKESGYERVVGRADTLASAMDRMALYYVERGEAREVSADKPVFKNPFNPRLEYRISSSSLSVNRVADYVAVYIVLVSMLIASIVDRKGKLEPQLLYHVMFSLLEPLWYVVEDFPPPADTRVPTHTVFDHLNAALMVSNWLPGSTGPPRGCLVVVDLASVHKWLEETRRLRDMWAASWLASWLAWMSVKSYVEKYGPDILVQPPSRLHPFYAAWLLSKTCGDDPGSWSSACKTASLLLGLPYYWPLDPTVPSIVSIALPPRECSKAKQEILKNYKEAWSLVSGWLADILDKLYNDIKNTECNGNGAGNGFIDRVIGSLNELGKLVRELEPPLPIRVHVNSVDHAWREASHLAAEIYGKLKEQRSQLVSLITQDNLTELLFFHVLVTRRARTSELRATGRRSGKAYLEMARMLYDSNAFENCSVCGMGFAIIDGEEVRKRTNSCNKRRKRREWLWLLRELSDEKLCPYCLAKRLLREYLHSGGAVDAVGIRMPEEVYERIGRTSVILYTSRRHLAYEELRNYVEQLLEPGLRDEVLVARLFVAPQKFLSGNDRQELESRISGEDETLVVVEAAESLVLEAAHDEGFVVSLEESGIEFSDGFLELLRSIARNPRIRSVHRRYAFVTADGDSMGSGVLSGRLPLSPREYAENAYNVNDPYAKSLAVELYSAIVELVEKHYHSQTSGERRLTTIITPSYRYTVSRALSAHAIIERHLVEAFEGMLIYSGGDDLTAIVPPALIVRNRLYHSGLLLVEASRHLYWGFSLRGLAKDFLDEKGYDWLARLIGVQTGFNKVPYTSIVVPALVAYGRSTALYYVDSKRPLWMVYREASELLESKDGVATVKATTRSTLSVKDVLIVASDSSGAVVFPFSIGSTGLAMHTSTMSSMLYLVDRRAVSSGIGYDFANYAREYYAMQFQGIWDKARLLVDMVVKRNTGSGGDVEAVKRTIYSGFVASPEEYSVYVNGEVPLAQLLVLTGDYVHVADGGVYASPIPQFFKAISVNKSAY